MKISISTEPSNQEAVDAINKKLGTSFTVFDYHAWESGQTGGNTQEFADAVKAYTGSTAYNAVSKYAYFAGYLKAAAKYIKGEK